MKSVNKEQHQALESAHCSAFVKRMLLCLFLLPFCFLDLAALPSAGNNQDQLASAVKIPRNIQVYFASSRLNEGSRSSPSYGGRRHLDLGSGSMEYGTATLKTPLGLLSCRQATNGAQFREMMRVESELWHAAQLNFIGCFTRDDLLEKVRNARNKICIYIHGYDKTFLESLQDIAILSADFAQYTEDKEDFLPIVFSWPSAGDKKKYSEDEASLEWSKKGFCDLLDSIIAEKSESAELEIVGHSMGNRLLVSYLQQRQKTGAGKKENTESPINNIYMCSADVDFHKFEELRPIIESQVKNHVYIFVSDRDRPLIMSQYMHGAPRLGRPIDPPGAEPTGTEAKNVQDVQANKDEPNKSKFTSGEFWSKLFLDAAEVWLGPGSSENPDVLQWLARNPSLSQEFGEKSRLIDLSDLAVANLGHALSSPLISSMIAGKMQLPQLKSRIVHKRPDKEYLNQCGGKPLVLYRYIRLDPY